MRTSNLSGICLLTAVDRNRHGCSSLIQVLLMSEFVIQ